MSNALQSYEEPSGGAMVAFDAYSAGEMALRLADLKSRLSVVQTFFREVMVEGQDYGVIPGTEKPALLKPGAEKLAELYGYSPIVKAIDETTGDGGFYECKVTMALVSRKTSQTVAEGLGSANTFEGRYRWRWVYEEKLPPGVDRSALTKRSGNKRNGQGTWTQFRVENDDMHALWNTVLKMAKKRALVDVVLSATRSSGLFTQDPEAFEKWVDDAHAIEGEIVDHRPPVQQPQRKSERAQPQQRAPQRDLAAEADGVQSVNEDTGELWSVEELLSLMKEYDPPLVQRDLSPVLGVTLTADNRVKAITNWLKEGPDRNLTSLCAEAHAKRSAKTQPEQEAFV